MTNEEVDHLVARLSQIILSAIKRQSLTLLQLVVETINTFYTVDGTAEVSIPKPEFIRRVREIEILVKGMVERGELHVTGEGKEALYSLGENVCIS